jgi:hypothetical protein
MILEINGMNAFVLKTKEVELGKLGRKQTGIEIYNIFF